MYELFNGLDYVRMYIYHLNYNKSLEDHIKKLDKFLNKLKSVGFKMNVEKSDIDDLLIISKKSLEDNIKKWGKVLNKLKSEKKWM